MHTQKSGLKVRCSHLGRKSPTGSWRTETRYDKAKQGPEQGPEMLSLDWNRGAKSGRNNCGTRKKGQKELEDWAEGWGSSLEGGAGDWGLGECQRGVEAQGSAERGNTEGRMGLRMKKGPIW